MAEEIINVRKTIEKKQLKMRLEEMIADCQKYDLLRAIYLLERIASYKTKNLDEKEAFSHSIKLIHNEGSQLKWYAR